MLKNKSEVQPADCSIKLKDLAGTVYSLA